MECEYWLLSSGIVGFLDEVEQLVSSRFYQFIIKYQRD